MADMATAMEAGDYAAAYAAFIKDPDAGTPGGLANAALLLAMCERFDEAEQLLVRTKAPAVEWIVRGERARLARSRDPGAAGKIAVPSPTRWLPYYAAMSQALVARDEALVAKLQAQPNEPPIAGYFLKHGGPPTPFEDLRDCDDGVGRMFELFVDGTVIYFPFELVKRIEFDKPSSFVTLYAPRARLTDRNGGVTNGFAPTLYPGSTTASTSTVRTGRETTFSYVGRACRGLGRRDYCIDGGTMMPMDGMRTIEFS